VPALKVWWETHMSKDARVLMNVQQTETVDLNYPVSEMEVHTENA